MIQAQMCIRDREKLELGEYGADYTADSDCVIEADFGWTVNKPVSYTHLDVYKRQSHLFMNTTMYGTPT